LKKGSIIIQALKQVQGLLVLKYKYQGNFPNIENYHSQIKYSLPFSGKWVVANGGVTKKTSHSWDIPTQRYAYDFIILDKIGNSFRGEETEVESFYCYGKDILAPADGIIVEVCAGNPNSNITKDRTVSCTACDIRGNYILICHSNNEYSLLAHLKPNSIIVSVGQSVKTGEKIAECGNSGNTTEPHLHFQIQLGRSFYSSPGLPIKFENIIVEDTPNYINFDDSHLNKQDTSFYPPYIEVGQTVGNINCNPK
jgi:hypothetical protein